MKDLERDVESAGKAYQKLRDKADDALGKIRADEAALQRLRDTGASGDRVVRAEERLATSRRNSARAIREAEDSHKGLLSAQERLGGSSDDLSGRFSRLSGFAGAAGSALAGAGVIAGGAALAGIAALGAGVVVAGRQLYELGAQFDDLSDSLTVKTGLSGAALDQLKGSIEKLGTTDVPDTFENIGNVAAEVTRNLHLSGQPLEDITSRLANLQRLGVDVDVRALGKAFRGFGVDVNGQVPALNGLYEASTKSGLSIDDMLASVVKGGPALRALGLTFGESAALVTTFEDAGLDADKSIAGLTKGLANFSKDGKTGSDALKEAVTQIKGLADAGNDAGAIDLSNKLFGAKGGVAFFDAIKSGSIDLQALSDSLSTTGTDINAVSDNTADWTERWQLLKNQAAQALEPLAAGVFNGVNDQLGSLADWVSDHQADIIGFFTGVGQAAVAMAEFAIKSVGMLASGIGQLLAPLTVTLSTILRGVAAFERIGGFTELADKLDGTADSLAGVSGDLIRFGETAKNTDLSALYGGLGRIGDNAKAAADNAALLKTGITTLPDGKTIVINDTTPENIQRLKDLGYAVTTLPNGQLTIRVDYKDNNGNSINPSQLGVSQRQQSAAAGNENVPKKASGGAIFGAGTATSDSIPALLSNGEHVWTAAEVKAAGGQGAMYAMRAAVVGGFAGGGDVPLGAVIIPKEKQNKKGKEVGGIPDVRPGNAPGTIAIPDWSKPGQGFGTPSDDWFNRPIDPNDRLFPDMMPPGQRGNWTLPSNRNKMFAAGGAVGAGGGEDRLKALKSFAAGIQGGKYVRGGPPGLSGTDCSGAQAAIADYITGTGGRFATGNEGPALLGKGFQLGDPPPGVGGYWIGWKNGGPGGGHTAGTIVDPLGGNVNVEMGGSSGGGAYGGGTGASAFANRAWIKLSEGLAAASKDAEGVGQAPPSSTDVKSSPKSAGGSGGEGGVSLPASFSDLATFGLDNLSVSTKVSENSPERTFDIGNAAGAAVGGQVQSALGVFGLKDSPPILRAASKLLGGIKVGGHDAGGGSDGSVFDGGNLFGGFGGGASAAPLSATSTATGAPPPDNEGDMHGTRAGQAPGPVTNIYAQDAEAALVKWQNLQDRRSAAKLSRF